MRNTQSIHKKKITLYTICDQPMRNIFEKQDDQKSMFLRKMYKMKYLLISSCV